MPATRINGVQLYWELSGASGDPLILVHGSWGDHQNWAPVVPALSRSFRVLTYDRRGHSQSERPPGQGSVREDVADLAALLDHLDFAPAHIVGSSFGGAIVLRLAVERPELFRSLVVHEPPVFRVLENVSTDRVGLAAARERIASVVALLEAGNLTEGARAFVETIAFGPGAWDGFPAALRETFVFNAPTWLDEVRDPDALGIDLSRLRAFSVPALVTLGDQSPPFFRSVTGRIAEALPRATMRTFAGAGHVPHLTHPDEYFTLVATFVNSGRG